MKRYLWKRMPIAVLALLMVLSMAACQTAAPTATPTAAPTTAATTEPTAAAPTESAAATEQAPAPTADAASTDPFAKHDPVVTIHAARQSRAVIKFIEGEDYDNNFWTQMIKDRLGIEMVYDWIVDESQYEARVNLQIASNEIPDCLNVTATQEKQLIEAGLVQDLTPIVDQYSASLLSQMIKADPKLYQIALTDGKLMDIPFMASKDFQMNMLAVRKDWLDAVGLGVPKTADEFFAVLDAFVNKDPDGNGQKDTIGLGINKNLSKSSGMGDVHPIFNMYKAYPGAWLKDASGKLAYGSVQPEVKAALQKLQDLYKAGLIDPEFAVKDEAKVGEDIVAEKLGLGFSVFWSPAYPWNNVVAKNPKAVDLVFVDIPSMDGQPVKSLVLMNPFNKMIVSTKCKNPEAVFQMVNYTEELMFGGIVGKDWTAARNDPKYKEVSGNFHLYPLMAMEPPTLNYQLLKWVTDCVDSKDINTAATEETRVEAAAAMKYLENGDTKEDPMNWAFWKMRYGPNSSQAIANMKQDTGAYIISEFTGVPGPVQTEKGSTLLKLENETITKIIMGQAPVDDFDKFVEQWKAAGGDELTAEINAWYDGQK